jgi:hypothetical protein
MSKTIEELLDECSDAPYTREQYDVDLARVLAVLCAKHGVTTRAEVHEIIRAHRYEHSDEDPEDEYIQLMAVSRTMGWP